MEKLAEYLKSRRKGDFARLIGTSPSYLSQILSGQKKPSLDMMARIESASDGYVDFNSWSPSAVTASMTVGGEGSLPDKKRGDIDAACQGDAA